MIAMIYDTPIATAKRMYETGHCDEQFLCRQCFLSGRNHGATSESMKVLAKEYLIKFLSSEEELLGVLL